MSSPVVLRSALLEAAGIRHGFFTRKGGVSPAPYDSLNFTALTGDRPSHVAANRERVANYLGVREELLLYPKQVHGVACLAGSAETPFSTIEEREADTVLSSDPQVGAAVRSADCVPILLAEKQGPWVAAVHSGWKGCAQNVVGVAIEELRKQGCGDLLAAIGPHISLASFEVSEETAAELLAASYDPEIVDRSLAKPHVDLRKMVRSQLRHAGLRDEEIDDVPGCTVLDADHFYSFRRDGEQSGRQLSAIVSPRRQ